MTNLCSMFFYCTNLYSQWLTFALILSLYQPLESMANLCSNSFTVSVSTSNNQTVALCSFTNNGQFFGLWSFTVSFYKCNGVKHLFCCSLKSLVSSLLYSYYHSDNLYFSIILTLIGWLCNGMKIIYLPFVVSLSTFVKFPFALQTSTFTFCLLRMLIYTVACCFFGIHLNIK